MPQANDNFDRMIGSLHGLPDVSSTKPATVRAIIPLIGASQTFIIQTYRQREAGDTVFIELVAAEQNVRIALPPAVADAIARQRSALTDRSRSRAAKELAAERKRQGIVPGFLRGNKKPARRAQK